MISLVQLLICVIVLHGGTSGLNSEVDGFAVAAPSTTTNAPLCRTVRNMKRALQDNFKSRYKNDLVCDIDPYAGCESVTCTSDVNEKVFGKLRLHVCDPTPWVAFTVETSGNGTEKWVQRFYVENHSQRVEIHHALKGNSQRWYLTVNLNLGESHIRATIQNVYNYLYLNATVEIRSSDEIKQIQQMVLIKTTRFSISQVCTSGVPVPRELQEKVHSLDLRRSLWRNEDLNGDILVAGNKRSSSPSGKTCDSRHIFACGPGATCVMTSGVGVCECLETFVRAENGSCIMKPADATVQPLPANSTSSAHASALGAIFSIIALFVIAAAVFFGTKYNVISRIRDHLPLQIRLWSSQSSATVDDQVDMVDPFSQDDDDPPLL